MHEEEKKCGCDGECSCESQGCGCGQSNCSCGSGCGCDSSGCEDSGCGSKMDMLGMLTYLAKEAKFKLLKEKMKKKLEEIEGKKLDQMANIAVEALLQSYKDKIEAEKKYEELREKLDSVLKQQR